MLTYHWWSFFYDSSYQSTTKIAYLTLYMEENAEPHCAGVT